MAQVRTHSRDGAPSLGLKCGADKCGVEMSSVDIFSPFRLGPLELPNRVVMAPMTRNRAGPGNVPTALNATYYAQRAGAGLIVSEATQVSPQGVAYPGTPGIHSAEQVAGWKLVTDAVHGAGGRIFLQLWHVGRISHPSMQPGGALPVAPSAIAPAGQAWTTNGMEAFVTPRALETNEIPGIVDDFRRGARNAREAGFDGVELHGANGYLIDQFLRDSTNKRTDRYGGSAANRARFLIEVTQALIGEWGGERVGVRLSPTNPYQRHRRQPSGGDVFDCRERAQPARHRLSAYRRAGTGRSGGRGRNAGHRFLPKDLARAAHRQQRLRSRTRQRGAARRRPPTWCRSPRSISPIPISTNASAAAARSIRRIARRSTAARRRAIRIIRRCKFRVSRRSSGLALPPPERGRIGGGPRICRMFYA